MNTFGRFFLGIVAVSLVAALATAGDAADTNISFKKTHIDATFRSEGVAAGDFNHDGKMDIAAGSVYYAAPDWKMVPILEKARGFEPKSYSNSFCNFAADLNGDGWDDLVVVDFPGKETWWYENPQTAAGPWEAHVCVKVTNNESPSLIDLDGDGKRELIFGDKDERMAIARRRSDPNALWDIRVISDPRDAKIQRYYHGVGAGDINSDGRQDLLVPDGWWEAPSSEGAGNWKFHKVPLGDLCSQMHVYDFDGDGDNDVLSSSAHAYGIWWHEQSPDGWKTHEIERSFSQTHSLCLADINGDSLPDFVTGKRWWAHGGHDPGGNEPAVMFWFELTRKDGRAVWIPHQFDRDSGVGTQFEVADMNGDGLLDVITSNKKGTHYMEQVRN